MNTVHNNNACSKTTWIMLLMIMYCITHHFKDFGKMLHRPAYFTHCDCDFQSRDIECKVPKSGFILSPSIRTLTKDVHWSETTNTLFHTGFLTNSMIWWPREMFSFKARSYVKDTVRVDLLHFQKYVTKTILLFNDNIALIQIYQNVFTCIYVTICELLIDYFN